MSNQTLRNKLPSIGKKSNLNLSGLNNQYSAKWKEKYIKNSKVEYAEQMFIKKSTKTSWANARVKLHSQVHFESKKVLGPKKCSVQKIFESTNFFGPVII